MKTLVIRIVLWCSLIGMSDVASHAKDKPPTQPTDNMPASESNVPQEQLPVADVSANLAAQVESLQKAKADLLLQVDTLTQEKTALADNIQSQTVEAEAQRRQAKDAKDSLAKSLRENKVYRDRLQTLDTTSPTEISWESVDWKTDSKAIIYLHTNKAGFISVTIVDPNNQRREKRSEYGQEHRVFFDNLRHSTRYAIEAKVIDWAGNPIESTLKTEAKDSRFFVETDSPIAAPIPQITCGDTTPDSIEVKVRMDGGQNTNWRVSCVLDEYTECGRVGDVSMDEFGRPVVPVGADKQATFRGLKSGELYTFRVEAINAQGKRSTEAFLPLRCGTKPKPKPFEFTGALELRMSPTGARLSWQATSEAVKGEFNMSAKTALDVTSGTSNAATLGAGGTTLTAEIDAAKWRKIVGDANQTNAPIPMLTISMSNAAGETRETKLAVQFVLGTKADVANSALPAKEKEKLNSIIDDVSSGKKVDVKKLLFVGLSFVASLL